ncbi:SDR family oxidoreductase [Amnibacterium setariae]|uniref:SDR family oxidoreductase n=1 Tax=Amnibacterium setariae TaxID=2306585 RepID=A0A3A1TYH5_9MICO|nr:SDR family oxidoreductase [Amnibacterium setariae]RIX27725.1 SDR family oxidoreductase [Amnibacterium setariae]
MTTIGITGATGHIGGTAARILGDRVGRVVVRNAARAPRLPGDPEVREAEYADGTAMRAALAGVDVLLLVSGAEAQDRLEQHRTAVRAAAEAGVRHVVYTSFDGAAPDADFTLGRDHWHTEEAIRASGMRWTFLRDSFYLDFFPLFAGEDGVIAGPAGDGRVAAVARADVAEVAAAVLADPAAHEDATYRLTGPEPVSFPEAAERMTAALGRPFRFADQTLEEAYASRRALTGEQWQLDAWVSTYTAIGSDELAAPSDDVARLTGHAPRTLQDALLGR